MKIQVGTPTIVRGVPEEYIHVTIRHLRTAGFFKNPENKFNLFVGSSNTGYVDCYKDDPTIVLHIPSVFPAKGEPAPRRGNWNYIRCLLPLSDDVTHIVVLEDDVQVALGWYERLQKCIEVAEASYGMSYALSLYEYHVGNGPLEAYERGEYLWADYPAENHACIQGMLFPRDVALRMYKYLKKRGYDEFKGENCDTIMYRLFLDDIKLLSTAPCLVQHIGEIGTGAGGGFHTTKYFVEDVRDV